MFANRGSEQLIIVFARRSNRLLCTYNEPIGPRDKYNKNAIDGQSLFLCSQSSNRYDLHLPLILTGSSDGSVANKSVLTRKKRDEIRRPYSKQTTRGEGVKTQSAKGAPSGAVALGLALASCRCTSDF